DAVDLALGDVAAVHDELPERGRDLAVAAQVLLQLHALLDVLLGDQARGDEEAADLGLADDVAAPGGADAGGQGGVEILLGQVSAGDKEDAERAGNARLALLGHLEEAFQERLSGHGLL